jgi:periplasmic mercuric ion binding protein
MALLKGLHMKNVFAGAAPAFTIGSAGAAPTTVILSVPSTNCPVCPITVEKALMGVAGMQKAAVDFEQLRATVTFDDGKTQVDALMRATRNAGCPSQPVKNVNP